MTSDKLSLLTRTAPMLSLVLMVGGILFAGPLATVQQTAATTTLTAEEQDIQDTQDFAAENITEEDRDVNGIEFTPRWGAVSTLEPNEIMVLFADCFEDEFAVSTQFVFETSDIIPSHSFPIASATDDLMTWIAVVENTDSSDNRAASIGVICAGENDGDDDDVDIDYTTKTTINNIVKQSINIVNNQIVNLDQVLNIHQTITQNAYQIVKITGNNNVVNQVINQTASQILNQNATAPTEIQQIIDQEAVQEGVIGGGGAGGNATSLSQLIEQDAAQGANVTGGGGPTTIDQAIDQGANQTANVTTGGNATSLSQLIEQDAAQGANVTGGGGPTTLEQLIDQEAEQQAQVDDTGEDDEDDETDGGAGNSTG
jgi:hypothetical protein